MNAEDMKRVYVIGGTMGVGKTTVCKLLKQRLNASVFLDADALWDMHPFVVTEETKAMVMNSIHFVLNGFVHCSAFENIIFCWVMHEKSILDAVIDGLDTKDCMVIPISLTCTPQALRQRFLQDVKMGIRKPDDVERSLARLALYAALPTRHIDTSCKTPEEVCEEILLPDSTYVSGS